MLTDELNKHWIKLFAKTCLGDLCPIQAVIGGVAAQEAMKVNDNSLILCSGMGRVNGMTFCRL